MLNDPKALAVLLTAVVTLGTFMTALGTLLWKVEKYRAGRLAETLDLKLENIKEVVALIGADIKNCVTKRECDKQTEYEESYRKLLREKIKATEETNLAFIQHLTEE